jgi:hypothetical protein
LWLSTLSNPTWQSFSKRNPYAHEILTFQSTGKWPAYLTKKQINQNFELFHKGFQDKNGLIWFLLTDYNYPRTALLLLQKYQKEALCEAHDSIFGGHDVTLKTYLKVTSSYLAQHLLGN